MDELNVLVIVKSSPRNNDLVQSVRKKKTAFGT